MSKTTMTDSDKIRAFLKNNGLFQYELANMADVSPSTMSYLINGIDNVSEPTRKAVMAIVEKRTRRPLDGSNSKKVLEAIDRNKDDIEQVIKQIAKIQNDVSDAQLDQMRMRFDYKIDHKGLWRAIVFLAIIDVILAVCLAF